MTIYMWHSEMYSLVFCLKQSEWWFLSLEFNHEGWSESVVSTYVVLVWLCRHIEHWAERMLFHILYLLLLMQIFQTKPRLKQCKVSRNTYGAIKCYENYVYRDPIKKVNISKCNFKINHYGIIFILDKKMHYLNQLIDNTAYRMIKEARRKFRMETWEQRHSAKGNIAIFNLDWIKSAQQQSKVPGRFWIALACTGCHLRHWGQIPLFLIQHLY